MTSLRQTYERYWTERVRDDSTRACAAATPNEIFESMDPVLGTGARLLDVGCGNGSIAALVSGRYRAVYGCDLASDAVRSARRGGLHAVCADVASRLPYRDGTFDCVTSIEVIEHVLDPLQFLLELKRVLKPGGTVILTTPNIRYFRHVLHLAIGGRFPHTTTDTFVWGGGHLHYFTRADVRDLLKKSGFVDAQFVLAGGQFVRSWKRRWLRALVGENRFGEWICGGITVKAVRP